MKDESLPEGMMYLVEVCRQHQLSFVRVRDVAMRHKAISGLTLIGDQLAVRENWVKIIEERESGK